MWHALRAELAYARPYLFGGLGIAAGVTVLLSVIFYVTDGPPPHAAAAIRAMFPVIAPMVVCFIVQAYRGEERRARLLLAGPLTPRQLAGVSALLPIALFAIGIFAAGLVLGLGAVLTGRLERESLHIVGFVGGQMFAYPMMALLIQESVAARGQGRPRVAAGGWAAFVLTVLALTVPYVGLAREVLTWAHLILAHLAVALAAMAASIVLYTGRTDFTR